MTSESKRRYLALKLRKKLAKRLKKIQKPPRSCDDIPETGDLFCNICGEMFLRKYIEDFREHMATHLASSVAWDLREQELAGSYDEIPPEIVDLTTKQYKCYIQGRRVQAVKELKEASDAEHAVRVRQFGGMAAPLPSIETSQPHPAPFPKVIMPAVRPRPPPRVPVSGHLAPNRPYFGANFGVRPVTPVSIAVTTTNGQKSDANSPKDRTPSIVQVAPNNPNFGAPRMFRPFNPAQNQKVRFVQHATTTVRFVQPSGAQRPIKVVSHGNTIIPNPGAPKIVRSIVPARTGQTISVVRAPIAANWSSGGPRQRVPVTRPSGVMTLPSILKGSRPPKLTPEVEVNVSSQESTSK